MSNITEEQIKRLKYIGNSIVDSIQSDYKLLSYRLDVIQADKDNCDRALKTINDSLENLNKGGA